MESIPFNVFVRRDTDGSVAGDPGSSQTIMIIQKSSFLARPGDEGNIDIYFGKKESTCVPNISTAVTFTATKFQ